MRILIIGEHSYIGNAFFDYITNQKIVKRTDKEEKLRMEKDNWTIEKVGASNDQWREKDFSGYDVILHVAALVHKKESKYEKEQYEKVNFQKVVEVARKAKKANVGQFIFLSTMAVYGEHVSRITEKTPLSPTSYYGISKLKAEKKLETMKSNSFHITIIRPPMVYGEGCPGNYTRLKKLAYYMPIFPNIENKRSMISIRRLCKCLKLVIERQIDGIICPRDRKPMQTTRLYRKMRKTIGKHTWTFSLGSRVIKIGCNHMSIVKKLFGDCYYDFQEKELLEVWEYQ